MNQGYTTAGWENFFFAEVGAAAALAGLLFVAVSINLPKVLASPSLPGRAFEALVVLFEVLLVATCALVPGQTIGTLGAEIVGLAALAWVVCIVIQVRSLRHTKGMPVRWIVSRAVLAQAALIPMIVAGCSLLAERGGGLYWTVPGVALGFLCALLDAWVLLVEIQR